MDARGGTGDAAGGGGCPARPGPAPGIYERRRPESTTLHQIVQQHLETYLALAGEADWDGWQVPAYVEETFRRYLECGILAHGFAGARCAECGCR